MAAGAADGTVDGIADGDGVAAGTVGAGGAAGARDTASLRCTTAGGARGAAAAGSEGDAVKRYQVRPLPTQTNKAGSDPGLCRLGAACSPSVLRPTQYGVRPRGPSPSPLALARRRALGVLAEPHPEL
jgi:hypothetical protein